MMNFIQALYDNPIYIFENDIEDPVAAELRDNPSILYPEAWDDLAAELDSREDARACARSHGRDTWCDCGGDR